jgi:hypothetical protein
LLVLPEGASASEKRTGKIASGTQLCNIATKVYPVFAMQDAGLQDCSCKRLLVMVDELGTSKVNNRKFCNSKIGGYHQSGIG